MVGATKDGGFTVQREKAAIGVDGLDDPHFEIDNGVFVSKSAHLNLAPRISSDRLFLTYVSSIPEFRILFDALSQMHFYSINPADIRQPQPHDAGDVLLRSAKEHSVAHASACGGRSQIVQSNPGLYSPDCART